MAVEKTNVEDKPKKTNGKAKGNVFERKIAKIMTEWTGIKFERVPASGGLHWKKDNRVYGDIVCNDPDFPFVIECKNREKWKMDNVFKGSAEVEKGWEQVTIDGIVKKLKALGISVKYDNADNKRPGFKFAEYELKGVPVRLVMGGRDLESNTIEVTRRDTFEKQTRSCDDIDTFVKQLLDDMQQNILQKALDLRTSLTCTVETYDEFKEKIEEGGFILAHWDGTSETEEKIKEETKATIQNVRQGWKNLTIQERNSFTNIANSKIAQLQADTNIYEFIERARNNQFGNQIARETIDLQKFISNVPRSTELTVQSIMDVLKILKGVKAYDTYGIPR